MATGTKKRKNPRFECLYCGRSWTAKSRGFKRPSHNCLNCATFAVKVEDDVDAKPKRRNVRRVRSKAA